MQSSNRLNPVLADREFSYAVPIGGLPNLKPVNSPEVATVTSAPPHATAGVTKLKCIVVAIVAVIAIAIAIAVGVVFGLRRNEVNNVSGTHNNAVRDLQVHNITVQSSDTKQTWRKLSVSRSIDRNTVP